MAIAFERLVGRNVARFISSELDLAGVKTSVNSIIGVAIVGGLALMVLAAFGTFLYLKLEPGLAMLSGIGAAAVFQVILYSVLEFRIEQRKEFVEGIMPDYMQLTSANIRSGVPLSRAMIMAVRPEFKYFGNDINIMGKQLYSGDTMHNAFMQLSNKYRSVTLKRTVRLILEADQYGGGMADLLGQISKDMRNSRMVQKEVSGQLFMYTIFIAFAALIGAPTLYGLTNQMIGVTSNIWSKISLGALQNAPSVGVSFIKLSKPLITPQNYYEFSLVAIIAITGFGAFIISAISSGNAFKGIRFLPVFIIIGLVIFFVVSAVMGSLFASFGTV